MEHLKNPEWYNKGYKNTYIVKDQQGSIVLQVDKGITAGYLTNDIYYHSKIPRSKYDQYCQDCEFVSGKCYFDYTYYSQNSDKIKSLRSILESSESAIWKYLEDLYREHFIKQSIYHTLYLRWILWRKRVLYWKLNNLIQKWLA